MTDSKTKQIYSFAWSPEGKLLILARGAATNVLIRDFK